MTVESFEHEVKSYFADRGINYLDNSSSYKELDFTILHKKTKEAAFHLEVKEKGQRYTEENWPKFAPEIHMFILDDLTIRKCLGRAPESGILIRDNLRSKYFFFSVIDLALMPKKRVNRKIEKKQLGLKGKWLVDLRNGREFQTLNDAISYIRDFLKELDEILYSRLDCYGTYVGENIMSGGVVRQPEHWTKDVRNTR